MRPKTQMRWLPRESGARCAWHNGFSLETLVSHGMTGSGGSELVLGLGVVAST